MEQIHILRWSGSELSGVYEVYSDHGKACRIAEKKNKKDRNWFNRLCGDGWVVRSYDVKD